MKYVKVVIQGFDDENNMEGEEYELRMGMGWLGQTPPLEAVTTVMSYMELAQANIRQLDGMEN